MQNIIKSKSKIEMLYDIINGLDISKMTKTINKAFRQSYDVISTVYFYYLKSSKGRSDKLYFIDVIACYDKGGK